MEFHSIECTPQRFLRFRPHPLNLQISGIIQQVIGGIRYYTVINLICRFVADRKKLADKISGLFPVPALVINPDIQKCIHPFGNRTVSGQNFTHSLLQTILFKLIRAIFHIGCPPFRICGKIKYMTKFLCLLPPKIFVLIQMPREPFMSQ